MEVDWRSIILSMTISGIALAFLVIFVLYPMVVSSNNSLVAQMSWISLSMFLITDFLVLTFVFYFLIFIRKSKKSEI
jgi:succinate dehydrogenase hydrophobic anchor subunit